MKSGEPDWFATPILFCRAMGQWCDCDMKECAERVVEVGFLRSPRKIVDEVEQVTAAMIREGWRLADTCMEDGLGNVHLFFERIIPMDDTTVHG